MLNDLRRLGRFRRENHHRGIVREVFAHGIRQYLRGDFHPDELDDYELARRLLEQVGLA